MTGELTGGRVNYYLATVLHPQRENQPAYVAECEDIIQALKMDFNEACEFKAIWRTAAARLGNGKPGQKALYDAEKRLHYAGRSVRELRLAAQQPEANGWIKYMGDGDIPESVEHHDNVVVIFGNGEESKTTRRANNWDWSQKDGIEGSRIAYFKKA